MNVLELAQVEVLGPTLADVTGDPRWSRLRATLLTGGKSNLTFLLYSDAGSLVLRRPPTGSLLPSAHDMSRETRVQRALAGSEVPVPRVVFEDNGDLTGCPCYVMERVEGHVIRDLLPAGYADQPADRARIGETLLRTLAALHEVDPAAVGLEKHGRPEGFFARQVARWSDQWERSKCADVPAVAELARRLAVRPPEVQRAAVLHGDFRLDNCILDRTDPGRVAAVLDWELSTLGDPLADLALTLFYWREAGEAPRLVTPSVTGLPGFPTRAEVASRYAELTGLDLADLQHHLGLAYFKFAVIAQGIARRASAGTMGGQDFGDLAPAVVAVAEEGLTVMEEGL